jgi:serine/threonine protein kinase
MAADMKLEPGSRLAHYEIVEMIGKGGMGEVYRATDTRLRREVAIKTSGQQFSERFEREAKVIASLNHPNICTLFDVGPDYLVMEMIEGPTLSEQIKDGALNLEQTSNIMRQVAEALEYAHEKGVVHRDLKPGNIKIRPDGVVKVLDFGLAKVVAAPAAASGAEAATITLGATQAGVVLGTAAYMSPEQAMGKPVDRRADVWSFGVVFHEMLTGARMHKGDSVQEIMAAVLKDEPDLSKVPPQTHKLLRRCLEKDPNKRLRHVGDVMALLEDSPASGSQAAVSPLPPSGGARKNWLWPSVAGVLFTALAAIAFLYMRDPAPPASTEQTRFQIAAPEMVNVDMFAVSPDGRRLVFLATGTDNIGRLWLRSLDSLESNPLPNSEGAFNPFWSPDSKFVAFVANRELKKIAIAGGPPQIICALPQGVAGGAWNQDDVIIFGSGQGIMKVSATGGTPSALTAPDLARNEIAHVHPSFLPGGRHFLYMRGAGTGAQNNEGISIGSLDAKPEEQDATRFLDVHFGAAYAPSPEPGRGQLLFLRDGTLWAQPFDAERLQVAGEPISVGERVGGDVRSWQGQFSASANGVLVSVVGAGPRDLQLTWFDRQGNILGTVGEPGAYSFVSLSPDASRAAVVQNGDVWLVDLGRATSTRFTYDPAAETNPLWSADGSKIAFASSRGGGFGIYQKASSGGSEELLLKSDTNVQPQQWSPDGRFLLYTIVDQKTSLDQWILPLTGDKKPFPFLRTEFVEMAPRISPDGRWVAYRSNETGRPEIYVQPFNPTEDAGTAAAGGKWLVSDAATGMPRWRADGKELYYLAPNANIMAVPLTTSPSFQPGAPQAMFQMPPAFMRAVQLPGVLTDITADSKRFLLAMPREQNTRDAFTVVMNWTVGLEH